MITIERTHDMSLVNRIVKHPKIWNSLTDDAQDKYWYPLDDANIHWLLVLIECIPAGVFMVHRHNQICWEIHTAILPEYWGERAREAAKAVLKYLFTNTDCEKLITNVPETNKAALRYAKASGMKLFGTNTKSFKKNGVLMDQYMLGIEKGEWLCL